MGSFFHPTLPSTPSTILLLRCWKLSKRKSGKDEKKGASFARPALRRVGSLVLPMAEAEVL